MTHLLRSSSGPRNSSIDHNIAISLDIFILQPPNDFFFILVAGWLVTRCARDTRSVPAVRLLYLLAPREGERVVSVSVLA